MKITQSESEFRENIIEMSDLTNWNDFCRGQVTYNEFYKLSSPEKKEKFVDYINEEGINELIEEDFWIGIFESKPNFENNEISGITDGFL